MVFTPDYTIRVNGESVNFLFNTRALRRYCEAHSLELADLYLKVQKALLEENDYTDELLQVKDFIISDFQSVLLHGHESWCAYNKQPFAAGELEADLWMDALGGIVEQKKAFGEVIVIIAKRLLNQSTKSEPTDEKKSQVTESA